MKRLRINLQIRASEVRVVDEDRRDPGIFAIADALKLVASRREDLVEIEPEAIPPLCQCIDYGKFRYRQLQDEKKKARLIDPIGSPGALLPPAPTPPDMRVPDRSSTGRDDSAVASV